MIVLMTGEIKAQVNIGDEFQPAPGVLFPFTSLGHFLSVVYRAIIVVAILWMGAHLIFGSLSYITAGGDPKAVDAARGRIFRAIIGLAIIIVAYWIGVIVQTITGIPITR